VESRRPSSRAAAEPDPRYWRSLTELEDREAFQKYLARAEGAIGADWNAATRRDFLRLLSASLALAGLSGCGRQPPETIVPYVRQPAEIVPGQTLYFATAMTLGGAATGLLVESHMGRPTKIEGNPLHPSVPPIFWTGDPTAAPGTSDAFSQAAILTLYDPDRSQTITRGGEISTWDAFVSELKPQLDAQRAVGGRGIRLITETVNSPSLVDQIRHFIEQYPEAQWVQYEPVNDDNPRAGSELAFGRFVDAHYDIAKADVILSLDCDFLVEGPDHLRNASGFAARRDLRADPGTVAAMNRLYALESTPTLTGVKADHRLPMAPDEIEAFAFALADRLGVDIGDSRQGPLPEQAQSWLAPVADDLRSYRRSGMPGTGLVLAGRYLSPRVHAVAHAINAALGAVGQGVSYTEPLAADSPAQYESLGRLVDDMQAGQVALLCVLDGNPAYASPSELNFAAALAKVPFRIRLGLYEDETSALCDWHLPLAHFLESWTDQRAADGTVTIGQPLIAPLYQGITATEFTAALLGEPGKTAHAIVKQYWANRRAEDDDFETIWQTALHNGVVPGTQLPEVSATVDLSRLSTELSSASSTRASGKTTTGEGGAEKVEIVFRPDPTIWDGRFANNGWLQELPKPLTKLTWDNAILISPRLAERLALADGDVVELEHAGRRVAGPVWRLPGQPEHTVTLHLGYGRTRAGSVGTGLGFSAYALQSHDSPWHATGATIRPTRRSVTLACTQQHHLMEGRDLVRSGTLDELRSDPEHPSFMRPRHETELTSLFPSVEYDGRKWAMTIDLNRCTGCSACIVACQAENNIPVVGKNQVARGREMHWIRVDSYYEGASDNPRVMHQPLPCMHCENAPCELVCPVAATVHDGEGLNEMVYNRCVGTRYCSNNCPYKVRRFNFLQYSDLTTPTLQLMHNPNVTVRNRGVMEKCTYCVQRISAAKIEADKREQPIADGQLVTACQAACPSQAITFGDLNEHGSRVARNSEDPLNYALLHELNTRPRTTYLAAVRNPNPAIAVADTAVES
jgi:molybdopterin-containing oxidoreductase family iron-sulfur binding subunit